MSYEEQERLVSIDPDELEEMKKRLKVYENDYDVLSRFLIVYCALPKGTVPDIGITTVEAYLTLMTRGTGPLKERLEKFISFGQQFLNAKKEDPS